MKASERRNALLALLEAKKGTNEPLSATYLASKVGVTRQVIVGDIALLRTAGARIIATPRGYLLSSEDAPSIGKHFIVCNHSAQEMGEELNTVVDFGGTVENVTVEHPIYGKLTGELKISSRYDVELFCHRVTEADALPLSALTEGIHTHEVTFSDEAAFERFCQALSEKGILLSYR